jgi:hypothetical protein
VGPVDIGHRKVEHDEGPDVSGGQRREELPEMASLDVLPSQTEANVNRGHLAPFACQLSDQNRAVEAAAGQHGDSIVYSHRAYGSPR